jgi:hypothetical protein
MPETGQIISTRYIDPEKLARLLTLKFGHNNYKVEVRKRTLKAIASANPGFR